MPGEVTVPWHSTSPWCWHHAEPYPLLVLPGYAAQAGVELQVLLGRQLVEERVELGAVAQALLDLQELLQDAGGGEGGTWGEGTAYRGQPIAHPLHTPLHWSIFYQATANRQPWPRAGVTCHPPDDGQRSRTQGCGATQADSTSFQETPKQTPSRPPQPHPPPSQPVPPNLCPLTKASPPVVLSSPVSILKVVVLPAPLTPSSPKHSPGRTPTHSRSTARMRPILRDLYTWWGRGRGLSLPRGTWDPRDPQP